MRCDCAQVAAKLVVYSGIKFCLMQVSHIHSLQYSLPDQGLSILLCHEKHSILLAMDGAIAGNHLTIVLQSSDLNLWVFGRNQVLQASQHVAGLQNQSYL